MSAPRPIRRLLVANRGEIARRVMATCRRLGIETVAVHSDVDAEAPFVREADLAVAIGGAAPADSYLRGDAVVDAARRTAADAIHPGYGFLSEDPAFARAVIDAGLVWIGPAPEVMAEMGSKLRARERLAAAGVPVLPGGPVDERADADALRRQGEAIGYPLLVKASAGGGGRGMRRVSAPADLAAAVEAARREAAAAFGDGTVFLERLVERPRHVEVQVLGDAHGTASALPERDCTIQRRHQKLVEESPAPDLDEAVRARLADAARAAVRELGYVGAGTVEFVLGPDGAGHFLEVNARLQVEHPVTEAVCGLDLVALQVRIAEGEPLPPEAIDPPARGHAIEARLVTEDPAEGWRPRVGRIVRFAVEADARFAVPPPTASATTVRVDAAAEADTEVGPDYDSLVAKVVVHAPTRAAATRRLADVLRRATLAGPGTARDLLVRTLESEAFATVAHDTQLLDGDALAELARPLAGPEDVRVAAAAVALADVARRRSRAPVLRELPAGFRNVGREPQRTVLRPGPAPPPGAPAAEDGGEHVVTYRLDRDGRAALLEVDGEPLPWRPIGVRPGADGRPGDVGAAGSPAVPSGGPRPVLAADDGPRAAASPADVRGRPWEAVVDLEHGGLRRRLHVLRAGAEAWVGDGRRAVHLHEPPRFRDPSALAAAGSLVAPLPGGVLRVLVAAGDRVDAGAPLVVLEAMKMEHEIAASGDGVVEEVHVAVGDQVAAGAPLVVLAADEG